MNTNSIFRTVTNAVNIVFNVFAAIIRMLAILVVFCGVLAPAFLSTKIGESIVSAVKECWQNIFWPAITANSAKALNAVIISSVDNFKLLLNNIPSNLMEYLIVGMLLWVSFVGIGRALGIRRFAKVPFITEESLRTAFGPLIETPQSRARTQPNGWHVEHETNENNNADRVINFNRYRGQHARNMHSQSAQ